MRKNILYIGLCIATLSMGFTGCAKNSESQVNVKIEKDSETLNYAYDVNEIKTTKLYEEKFKAMIEKIGEIDFHAMSDMAIEYSKDSTIINPANNSIGQIMINDKNGNYVCYTFYPNKEGKQTLSSINYGTDLMEVIVSDEKHTDSNKFYTYMITRDDSKKEVNSEDDLRKFAFVISKDYEEAYKKKVEKNEKFEVTFEVEPIQKENGTASLRINTNLPDQTELAVSLTSGVYVGQTVVTIENGTAETEVFTDRGFALAGGTYTVGIYMSSPVSQVQEVQDIVGVNGEFMTGKYVQRIKGYNSYRVEAEIPVEIN